MADKRWESKLLQVKIPIELYNELTKEADKLGESVSTLTRSILRQHFGQEQYHQMELDECSTMPLPEE